MRLVAAALALLLAAPLAAQTGLGLDFKPQPDGLLVERIWIGSAGDAAGIRPDDVVMSLSGRSMAGIAPEEALAWVETVNASPDAARLEIQRGAGTPFASSVTPRPYERRRSKVSINTARPGTIPPASTPPAVPLAKGCISGDCADGTGSWRYDNGDTYVGAWRGGARHGRGAFTRAVGSAYDGNWVSGELVRGTSRDDQTGIVYEGEFQNLEWHGEGTMTFSNGSRFAVTRREGKPHGRGTRTSADGMTTVGEWVDGEMVRARQTYINGSVYEGEYANGRYHGQGTLRYRDGRVESGEWRDGTFAGEPTPAPSAPSPPVASAPSASGQGCVSGACSTGNGTYRYPSGNVYAGDFVNGQRHGTGMMAFTNGLTHTGAWRNNLRHGPGTSTGLGMTIVGEWADDRTVRGVVSQSDGSVYSGELGGISPHGQGTMTYADGRVETGEWSDGEFVGGAPAPVATAPPASGAACLSGDCTDGTGTYRYSSGAVYVGGLDGGKRQGYGTYTASDGTAATGEWTADVLSQGEYRFTDGSVYVGEFKDWLRHGQGTQTLAMGTVLTGEWVDDAIVRGRYTFLNGNVYEGEFTAGKLHGQGTMTYADGRIETGEWRDGDFVGGDD